MSDTLILDGNDVQLKLLFRHTKESFLNFVSIVHRSRVFNVTGVFQELFSAPSIYNHQSSSSMFFKYFTASLEGSGTSLALQLEDDSVTRKASVNPSALQTSNSYQCFDVTASLPKILILWWNINYA